MFLPKKGSLSSSQRLLLKDGLLLLKRIEEKELDHVSDYSFLVAPFAKAYEGFLKDFFLKLGLIGKKDYYSDRFRVGKVLNPSLRERNFSVYSRLEESGEEGRELAKILWRAWKRGRNLIFHYFPGNLNKLNIKEAKERIKLIIEAIEMASLLVDKNEPIGDNLEP